MMMKKSKETEAQSAAKITSTYGTKPLLSVLSGIGLIVLWYVFVAASEVFMESIFPDIHEFFESFSYLVVDWQLEELVTVFIVHVFFKRIYGKGLTAIQWTHKQAIYLLSSSVLIGSIVYYFQNFIYNFMKEFLPENYPAQAISEILESFTEPHQKWIIYFMIVIVTPIGEEIFMRGFCYRLLREHFTTIGSAMITSVIFVVFHPILAWIPHLFISSLIVCVAYEKTKFIGVPIVLHASINFCALVFD